LEEKSREGVVPSNPPWWGETKACAIPATGRRFSDVHRGYPRRFKVPFTFLLRRLPTSPTAIFSHTHLHGLRDTYLAKADGADATFRDSIALRESYDRYYSYLRQEEIRLHRDRIRSPSWEHDRQLIMEIKRLLRRPPCRAPARSPHGPGPAGGRADPCLRARRYEKGVAKIIGGRRGRHRF